MNKAELISEISSDSKVGRKYVDKTIESFMTVVSKALENNDKITLIGFGTFSVIERKARTGINPRTGEKIEIEAKKVIRFNPGTKLKDSLK